MLMVTKFNFKLIEDAFRILDLFTPKTLVSDFFYRPYKMICTLLREIF